MSAAIADSDCIDAHGVRFPLWSVIGDGVMYKDSETEARAWLAEQLAGP